MNISIGIDIGGTNTEIGWVTPKGDILKHMSFKTSDFPKRGTAPIGSNIWWRS